MDKDDGCREFFVEDFRAPDPPEVENPSIGCHGLVDCEIQAMQGNIADLSVEFHC